MKQWIALILALCLLLSGCGSAPAEETTLPTTAPTTEPATEPTTEPTTEPPPVYTNPLNGEVIPEPYTGRIFASTISNIRDALPHVSVNEADILMEMFVNGSVIRCVALFSDISDINAIGSVRSTRLMFNDIAEHYNAVLLHAAGVSSVLKDMAAREVDNINLDSWRASEAGASYRDKEYGRGYEHTLFGIGPGILSYAEEQGIPTTVSEGADYGLLFAEDGTPAGGEAADSINIRIKYGSTKKDTVMEYDPETGRYTFWQYEKMMTDQITGEPETFRNVVVMFASIGQNGIYHTADFTAGGEGYFACGGRIIPITWTCGGDKEPFRFFTAEGEPLAFGVGNTYIAITSPEGSATWTAAEAGKDAE